MQKRVLFFVFLTFLLLSLNVDASHLSKRKQDVVPQLYMSMPSDSQVVVGNYMTVSVFSSNTRIKQSSRKNKDGEGHLEISVDNGSPLTVYRTSYRLNIAKLDAGFHTLTVELVQNDGSSFSPVVKNSVEFSVVRSGLVRMNELQKHQRRQNPQRFHPARVFSWKRI